MLRCFVPGSGTSQQDFCWGLQQTSESCDRWKVLLVLGSLCQQMAAWFVAVLGARVSVRARMGGMAGSTPSSSVCVRG